MEGNIWLTNSSKSNDTGLIPKTLAETMEEVLIKPTQIVTKAVASVTDQKLEACYKSKAAKELLLKQTKLLDR